MSCIPIPAGFTQGERFEGIKNTRGQKAGIEQNWGYYAKDEQEHDCILLYCNPGVYAIIDTLEDIRVVHEKQVSWYLMKTGYIGCHAERNGVKTCLTMHQVIMNHVGHGKGGPSIDHINRNKLDNRRANLRITTQTVQNENRDKVSRHRTAKELPNEIQEELPKFVVYYKEKVNENSTREFFTVEGHPLQKLKEKNVVNSQTEQLVSRRWATTKSINTSITDKLQQAKSYVDELDKLLKNPLYTMTPIIKSIDNPVIDTNEIVIPLEKEPIEVQQMDKKEEAIVPKQWKSASIYRAIIANQENEYKTYCESANDVIKNSNWETDWATFVLSVKGKSYEESESIIKAFVENLRRLRHNAQILSKNINPIERDSRQQWPATTVVKAFLEGKMEGFKHYHETKMNESSNDPKWIKRWAAFIASLEQHRNHHDMLKDLCSKFMTAQRTKKYRMSMNAVI